MNSQSVSAMSNSSELQQIARLVEINRNRMEEVQAQLSRIDAVLYEHEEAKIALQSLSEGNSGHIPLGAGVMVPLAKEVTTIVDLGSGIFGEKSPLDAKDIVQERMGDLQDLKSQFEKEVETISLRIEELSKSFDVASKQITAPVAEEKSESEPETQPKPKPRRRRRMGEELTLDD